MSETASVTVSTNLNIQNTDSSTRESVKKPKNRCAAKASNGMGKKGEPISENHERRDSKGSLRFLLRAAKIINGLECCDGLKPVMLQYICDHLTEEDLTEPSVEKLVFEFNRTLYSGEQMKIDMSATKKFNRYSALAAIADKTGISYDDLSSIYAIQNGRLSVHTPTETLDTKESERNRTVAILCAGYCWIADRRMEIPIDEVRRIAREHYEVSRNLVKHLTAVHGFHISGEGKSKMIILQQDIFLPVFQSALSRVLGHPTVQGISI
ncbi:hypothetical protein [Bifidobacterium felsineum]|uniref:hypothetical protein n=1 Tax=Bifidobacterium felsineum TaxID=2045440 RepID=UPI001BDDB583|nr:hypothetical protein [Bifidobacterium felsineum]MBT1165071.1 hypothetical protein [Bifidobacterium felsineum]